MTTRNYLETTLLLGVLTMPLPGRGVMNLFSTHPPVEERVRRLLGRQPTR